MGKLGVVLARGVDYNKQVVEQKVKEQGFDLTLKQVRFLRLFPAWRSSGQVEELLKFLDKIKNEQQKRRCWFDLSKMQETN